MQTVGVMLATVLLPEKLQVLYLKQLHPSNQQIMQEHQKAQAQAHISPQIQHHHPRHLEGNEFEYQG